MAFLSEGGWWLLTGLQLVAATAAGYTPWMLAAGRGPVYAGSILVCLTCQGLQWGLFGFWGWFFGMVAMLSVWCRITGLLRRRLGEPKPEQDSSPVAADMHRAETERHRYWETVGALAPSERTVLIRRSNEKQELWARAAIRFLGPNPLVRRLGLNDAQIEELVGLIQAELGPVRPETIRYFLGRQDVVLRYVEWQQSGLTVDLTRLREVIHGDE